MGLHGQSMLEPATVIVAIDFGTTYSGFSYAHMHLAEQDAENFIDHVEGFEQWPSQGKAGAKEYCKTQTSLLYVQKDSDSTEFELKAWGWTAFNEHIKLLQASARNELGGKSLHFITNFKLALAKSNRYGNSYKLPDGFTVQRVISDYLHELSILIEKELQKKYGDHIRKKDVQWCLTVPAIWDNTSKQQMRKCAEIAGLVAGPLNTHGEGSAHPIIIVLEPEAASVYCLHYLRKTNNTDLPAKSKILIADAGGGTVDLVFHEKVDSESNSHQVKEICSGSSGALCGATFVDKAFYKLLGEKITCYEEFIKEHPSAVVKIRQIWESLKVCFDGSPGPYEFWLPAQLGNYWEAHDKDNADHDDIKISLEEMKSVFDVAVDAILELIENQLQEVEFGHVDAIMVVGGFSGSPYLMDRIRNSFSTRVARIINPTHPGKAVVTGAVVYGGLGREIIISRIARKTYGIGTTRDFRQTDPEAYLTRNDDGRPQCQYVFHVYTRKGDEVPVDYCEKRVYTPLVRGRGNGPDEDFITLEVYSTSDSDPTFVTDPGCFKECSYAFPIPSKDVMREAPKIEVSMYFGRTSIEVSATALNFGTEKAILPELTFETEAEP